MLALEGAAVAGGRSLAAGSFEARDDAGFSSLGVFFIDESIAVIVFVVALFGRGDLFSLAGGPLSLLAGLRAIVTASHLLRGGGAGVTGACLAALAVAIFVGLAIAVIIEAIANFGGGGA